MPPSSTTSDSNDLLNTVQQTLATHHMLAPGDHVLVGVSGGPDSMALLHLLSRIARPLEIRLGVAHLNHCLRGASADRDAEVVRQAAADFRYSCHIGRAKVIKVKQQLGLSLEDAARRVRYAFFKKTMAQAGYNKLALGHQMDDNAEQMLMALLRGTGPRGLSGIAPVRGNCIVRPLINARRAQIDAFVAAEGITCVLDASNADLRFVRNRIRHRLLPLLSSAYNPRIEEHLNRLADVMRGEETWIEELTVAPYAAAVLDRGNDSLTLCVKTLGRTHAALARRLIRMALKEIGGTLQRITFAHVAAVLGLLGNTGTEKELHLPGGLRVRRCGGRMTFHLTAKHGRGAAKPLQEKTPVAPTIIPAAFPVTVEMASMGIGMRLSLCRPDQLPKWADVGPNQAYFDIDRLSLPLAVRRAVAGDRFTPLGTSGSQKLKKFFIDHRILRQVRAMTPVLLDQQRIIWLVGQRIDDHVKVTSETSQVLSVEFFLLDTR